MSHYRVEATERFGKDLKKLDRYTQKLIKGWIVKNLSHIEDPRSKGKALKANLSGLWRYCVGDYRLICKIEDSELVILALSIGHRREIYE